MKATTIFLLFMFVAFLSTGQDVVKTKMLKGVEVKPPVFTGIENVMKIVDAANYMSIDDYLVENIQYPERSEDFYRQGTEIIHFTVLPTGKLENFHVISSVSEEVDNEVVSVLKATDGMWKPGQNNGISVAMEKEVAITFKMENSDHMKIAQKLFKRGNKKLQKDKPKRALKLFDNALVYQPYSEALLFRRGVTRLAVGNKMGACEDWNRLKSLGYDVADGYLMKYCEEDEFALK